MINKKDNYQKYAPTLENLQGAVCEHIQKGTNGNKNYSCGSTSEYKCPDMIPINGLNLCGRVVKILSNKEEDLPFIVNPKKDNLSDSV